MHADRASVFRDLHVRHMWLTAGCSRLFDALEAFALLLNGMQARLLPEEERIVASVRRLHSSPPDYSQLNGLLLID